MTELFLKKDGGDWQQVYFSTSGSGFKLTRENPYFTESESYTLDVSLPMDILDNRRFFGNLQRIDTTKKSTKYQCRLMVGNKSMLDGTARVSQVTHDTIKVQLLGGNSELNFLSKESGAYIDEMDLELNLKDKWFNMPDRPMYVTYMPAYDETNDKMMNAWMYEKSSGKWMSWENIAPQPNLLYILYTVLQRLDFTVVQCDFDCEPWNRLYVASAKETLKMSHPLPHWRVGEFLSEICKFFNCTLSVDSRNKIVSFINNTELFGSDEKTEIVPVDEYTTEIDDDESKEALASSNIEYDMSSSYTHVYDVLSDDIREAIPHKNYDSEADLFHDFLCLSDKEKMKYLFICPTGKFIGWRGDKDNEERPPGYSQVDFFAPLKRNTASDNAISLKICPVALTYSDDALYYKHEDDFTPKDKTSSVIMTLENPTGNEGIFDIEDESASAQDFIEGKESVEKAEKEDRLQVFFLDTKQQLSVIKSGKDKGKTIPVTMPFTDFNYYGRIHYHEFSPWSLSLNPSDATHYLGQLHNTGFSFNTKAKHTFRFIADTMPDPTGVFLIHGKLYGCEKIEANVTEEGFDRLMTGYFYEML